MIAIGEDKEPANGGAHAQEAQARLIPAPPAGALPQVWCCARTLGEKDAVRGYYCPDSNAGPAFLSTPVLKDGQPSDRRQKLNLEPEIETFTSSQPSLLKRHLIPLIFITVH